MLRHYQRISKIYGEKSLLCEWNFLKDTLGAGTSKNVHISEHKNVVLCIHVWVNGSLDLWTFFFLRHLIDFDKTIAGIVDTMEVIES